MTHSTSPTTDTPAMADSQAATHARPAGPPETRQPRAPAGAPTGWRYRLTVRAVAEQLFHQALARGEGVADIGLLGPSAYLDDAAHTLWSIAVGDERAQPSRP